MHTFTLGNSAKLYCLNWIENIFLQRRSYKTGGEFQILDLGCGRANHFVNLLELYPEIRYVGVEPSKQRCLQARENLKHLNGTIINAYAYGVFEMLKEKVKVDWDADPNKLRSMPEVTDGSPFQVVTLKSGTNTHWQSKEPNKLIHDWLRENK